MNYLITVIGITIVSLLLASIFFLHTQTAYETDAYGQGNDDEEDDEEDDDEIKDSQEATEEEEVAIEYAEVEDDY